MDVTAKVSRLLPSFLLLVCGALAIFYAATAKNTRIGQESLASNSQYAEESVALQTSYNLIERTTFEKPNEMCSVKIVTNRHDSKTGSGAISRSKACSFEMFDDYFKETGHFYGSGYWDNTSSRYHPEHCAFRRYLETNSQLENCLVKKNITKILVTGDSTGRMLFSALVEFIQNQQGFSCEMKKHSGGFNMNRTGFNKEKELEYFLVPELPPETLIAEPCSFLFSGHSFQYECKCKETNRVLQLEYISSIRAVDTTLHINRSTVGKHKLAIRAENKMEYLLTWYLPYHGFPDFWIYNPYFRHECWSTGPLQLMADLSYLFTLFEMYLPNSTDLIFLGETVVCEEMFSPGTREAFKRKSGVSENERLHEFNQILYHLLRPIHSRMKNWHAFIDGMKVTCPLTCWFHVDGAHLSK